jgi:hypothetical protein
MLQCKVDYLYIFGRKDHAIALYFWDDEETDKEKSAAHIALDADIFKKNTLHQIADMLEISINACLEKINQKEKEDGRQEVYTESNQEAGRVA